METNTCMHMIIIFCWGVYAWILLYHNTNKNCYLKVIVPVIDQEIINYTKINILFLSFPSEI